MKEFFELGRVLKPQGIKGEVKVEAYTDSLDRFDYLDHIYLSDGNGYVKKNVSKARADSRFGYLTLEGTADRNAAEALRGQTIFIDRAHAAKLPEGAYYIEDLLGSAIYTEDGGKIGTLKDIQQNGSADIYVVEIEENSSCMFPAIDSVVVQKEPEDGRIIVNKNALNEVAIYDR